MTGRVRRRLVRRHSRAAWLTVLSASVSAAAALALGACGGGIPATDARPSPTAAEARGAGTVAAAPADASFPTGPAVTVPAGYAPPRDRVDSTGAFLPANGRPTLVFVDAIW